jgi:hypothetical protein
MFLFRGDLVNCLRTTLVEKETTRGLGDLYLSEKPGTVEGLE